MGRPLHTHCSFCGALKKIIADGEGKRSICQPCINKRNHRRTRGSDRVRAVQIWSNVRSRAERKGLDFNLPKQWVIDKVVAGVCEVSGIKLCIKSLEEINNPLAPSIDRIDPKKGYIEGNVRVVCWIYNRAKGDGTDQDVINLMEALYGIHQRQQPIQG